MSASDRGMEAIKPTLLLKEQAPSLDCGREGVVFLYI
jgi:hypothetical protein